jgi:hypothetical protein
MEEKDEDEDEEEEATRGASSSSPIPLGAGVQTSTLSSEGEGLTRTSRSPGAAERQQTTWSSRQSGAIPPPPPAPILFAFTHPQRLLRGIASNEFWWGPTEQRALEHYSATHLEEDDGGGSADGECGHPCDSDDDEVGDDDHLGDDGESFTEHSPRRRSSIHSNSVKASPTTATSRSRPSEPSQLATVSPWDTVAAKIRGRLRVLSKVVSAEEKERAAADKAATAATRMQAIARGRTARGEALLRKTALFNMKVAGSRKFNEGALRELELLRTTVGPIDLGRP